jgi:Mce-associated membrane protein
VTDEQPDGLDAPIDDTETDAETTVAQRDPARSGRMVAIGRWAHAGASRWRLILLTLLTVGAVGLAGGLFYFQYNPDQRTADAAAQRVLRAASDGTVALLSYSPNSLDADFARAKSHLTGDLLTYYSKYTTETVGPTAKQKQITASAKVLRAAVSKLQPDSAVVLAYLHQITVSKDKPKPEESTSSVLITLAKVRNSWLIAKFDRL